MIELFKQRRRKRRTRRILWGNSPAENFTTKTQQRNYRRLQNIGKTANVQKNAGRKGRRERKLVPCPRRGSHALTCDHLICARRDVPAGNNARRARMNTAEVRKEECEYTELIDAHACTCGKREVRQRREERGSTRQDRPTANQGSGYPIDVITTVARDQSWFAAPFSSPAFFCAALSSQRILVAFWH